MDYPRDRFEVQVLDDSTDETRSIAELAVRRAAAQGLDITYLHRTDRTGFKAGALEAGMQVAKGEFLAIFDADFLPSREFLHQTIHHFVDPKVGRGPGALGPHQRGLLAAHQDSVDPARRATSCSSTAAAIAPGISSTSTARPASGGATAIIDGGGWQHDTLTEDLDLSYRTQLRGWKFHFVPDVVVPAELPVEMNAFKSQQHRWAKGSIQTCRKLLPRILASQPAARA